MNPVDVVRRYLTVFETGDVDEMVDLVAEDVEVWGNTYRHDASGADVTQTGLKMYQVADGRIVRSGGRPICSGCCASSARSRPG